MTAPAPDAVRLRDQLAAGGWTAVLTEGAGTVEVQRLGENRPDGTRPRVLTATPCRSVAVRARHPDGRGALAAVWLSTRATAKGAPSWKFDTCWTWTECTDPACPFAARSHPDGLPVRLGRAELAEHVAAAAADAELYLIEQVAA